jgi:hypothetical protein
MRTCSAIDFLGMSTYGVSEQDVRRWPMISSRKCLLQNQSV